MADSVHFLGRDVPGAPDQGCCGNGFGIPFIARASDPPRFPIVVDFDECIKWYWRIKNFSLATDFDYDGTPLVSGTLTPASGHTRELDLTTALSGNEFALGGGTNNVSLRLFQNVLSPCVAFDDPDYYPSIRVDGSIGAVSFDSRSDQFTPDGTVTGSIVGISLPIYYTNPGPGTFTGTQLDFSPVAYWPYKGADGNPIYSATTGAQLQDPRN